MELKNRTVAFLGDSLTEGYGTSDKKYRYDNRAAEILGFRPLNYGIGGTKIAHQRRASEKPRWDLCFCGRVYDIDPSADVIFVFGGTNDYGHGDAPFGAMTDSTPDTFCGGVDFLMRFLLENYPQAKVAFMTPIRRQGGSLVSTLVEKRPDAKPLWEYARVILEKGAQYGVPVLNAYDTLDIDPEDPADCEAFTTDGTHLNDEGQARLAQIVAEFLKAL